HGARPPLDARHMGLREAPTIARTLVYGGDFDSLELGLQLIEREFARGVRAGSPYPELPRARVHLWNIRQMVADEEGVIGGKRTVEIADRGLVIGRPVGFLDEG